MRFGIDQRNRLTGSDLYVRVFQIASLLPVLYVLVACVHPAVFTTRNVFSVLFDAGMSALPRWEALVLSWLYRTTGSEVLFCFVMLAVALAFGLAAGRLLKGARRGRVVRIVLAILIVLDLILRVVPTSFRFSFGVPATVIGFIIRLGCLALILLDLRTDRRNTCK